MAPVQRKIALRVISGYRSISQSAVFVLAGMAPISLLAKESTNTWKKQQLEKVAMPNLRRFMRDSLSQSSVKCRGYLKFGKK